MTLHAVWADNDQPVMDVVSLIQPGGTSDSAAN
jgi:hypothetical protein